MVKKSTTKPPRNTPKTPRVRYLVRGRVTNAGAGQLVRAYNKDLRSEQLLGEARTNANGDYAIKYSASKFKRAEAGTADLRVAVCRDDGTERVSSRIFFNVPPNQLVDLEVVPDTPSPSDFARERSAIEPVRRDIPWIELKDDDVAFLSGDTGVDRQHIAWLVQAAKRQAQAGKGLTAEVFYGWFREGLPETLEELSAQSPTVLRSALERAGSRNVITPLTAQTLDDVDARVRAVKVNRTLSTKTTKDAASVADLLAGVLPRHKQAAVAQALMDHQRGSDDFWRSLATNGLNDDDVKSAQRMFTFGDLSGGYLPLVQELRRMSDEDPAFAGPHGLAQLDEAGWRAVLERPRDPADDRSAPIGHPDSHSDIAGYARALNEYVERTYPSQVIANRLARDDSDQNPVGDSKDDFATFFANNPQFTFNETPIELYLSVDGGDKLRDLKDPDGFKTQLKNVDRVLKVASTYLATRQLLNDRIHSAQGVVLLGPTEFNRRYSGAFGGEDAATHAFNKATDITFAAMNLYLKLGVIANSPQPYVIGSPASAASAMSAADQATWRTLFGSLDLCDCEHCQSLYSPAAYFADTLIFLQHGVRTSGKTPLDVLLDRRPDIAQLELTCDNTDVELPYTDLVNEILENAISPARLSVIGDFVASDFDHGTLFPELINALQLSKRAEMVTEVAGARWAIRDTGWRYVFTFNAARTGVDVQFYPQSGGTAAELGANPEHLNAKAYRKLAFAGYPWQFPFTLPVEEARIYLGQLGVQRYQLMEALTPPDDVLDSNAIAYEYLGLSAKEAGIVSGSVTTDPARPVVLGGGGQPQSFWGFSAANVAVRDPANPQQQLIGVWNAILARVSIFLAQSGLKYRELLTLMGTWFINPDDQGARALSIRSIDASDPATCDLTRLEIHDSTAQAVGAANILNPATLSKWHRFVRLQRALGWRPNDLDKAITALNGAALDAAFLRRLSHVMRLQKALQLSVPQLLAFWADIDRAEYLDYSHDDGEPAVLPSLYAQLFRNKTVVHPVDPAFAEDATTLNGSLAAHAATVIGALRVSAADFALLAASVLTNDALDLSNLSRLYRHATLARALKLSIQQLLQAKTLLAIDPFATTKDTVTFVAKIETIRDAGFRIEQLVYLLRHESADPHVFTAANREAAAVLTPLRDGLRKIADDQTPAPDPGGEITAQKLALLRWNAVHISRVVALLGDGEEFATPLAPLPAGLDVPAAVADRLSYSGGRLRFSGVITNASKQALLAATAAPGADLTDYTAAVNQLAADSTGAAKTFIAERMRAFELPTFSVDSQGLPQGVVVPPALQPRFHYDAAAGKLEFVGAMTKEDNAALLALSQDGAYRGQVNALFALPTTFAVAAENQFLVAAGDASFTALFESGRSAAERFAFVLQKLCDYLRATSSANLVTQTLTAALPLEAATVEDLLTERLRASSDVTQKAMVDFLLPDFIGSHGVLDAATYPDPFETFTRLRKVAALVGTVPITRDQLAWVSTLAAVTGWLNWDALPVAAGAPPVPFVAWERLTRALRLCAAPFHDGTALFELIEQAADAGVDRDEFLGSLSDATGWSRDDLAALVGDANAAAPASDNGLPLLMYRTDVTDERAFARLHGCFTLMKRLGASAVQLAEWGRAQLSDGTLSDAEWARALGSARGIRNAVRAKYEDAQWADLAKPLRDTLREKQRAALVDYLVAQKQYGVDDVDLYDYFLIDVDMSPCMMTTRLKQATCSVQLFVQRCLMNLEAQARLSADGALEWNQWRKLYRVWEANRKVFLYPENWIEAALRDNKSWFFKELEGELQQNDITDANAEDAFLHYLEKLDRVARLEIAGLYFQTDPKQILHVFGRTYATPHLYFYCRREDAIWSPWEPVPLDIDGDHLMPVEWNRRLYLFWPVFTDKTDQQTRDERAQNADPKRHWEIKLAWSELKNGKWSPKRVGKQPLAHDIYPDPKRRIPQALKDFSFKTVVGDEVLIGCYGTIDNSPPQSEEAPPVHHVRTEKIALLDHAQHPDPYRVRFVFTVRGNVPLKNQRDQIQLEIRDTQGNSETYPLNNAGEVELPYEVANDMTAYVVSDVYVYNPADSLVGIENGVIVERIDLKLPATASNQQILISEETRTTQTWKAMQLLGGFSLDSAHSDLTASDDRVALIARKLPAELTPMQGATIEYMAQTGSGPFQGAGTLTLLGKTPGGYHLVSPHKVPVYASAIAAQLSASAVPIPSVYEDASHDYVITKWEGSPISLQPLFSAFYHPAASFFIKTLNRFGVDGLLTLANQRITIGDHFYTTSAFERDNAVTQYGYQREGIVGHVFANQAAGTIPLYRLLNNATGDHFYTTSAVERDQVVAQSGYHSEGVACYVYGSQAADTVPLYRLYFPRVGDHFYATQASGQLTAFKEYGYQSETAPTDKVACYVFDEPTPGTTPLYRLVNQQILFDRAYAPNNSLVPKPRPVENIDFDYHGAYSLYNWELFFHIPFLIATRLTANQRFDEARKWFHYIFDPTSRETGDRERFWKVLPFHQEASKAPQTLEAFLKTEAAALDEQVAAMKAHPFQPHVIARLRLLAYMKSVVMKYIDNLIAWGDQLFARDTIESINEATQLYILASRILGKKPESIPARARPRVQTFSTFSAANPNSFSNALVEIESFVFPSAPSNVTTLGNGVQSLGSMPLFCLPKNNELLAYWDTVADRLFKIRCCMNIDGVVRQLPIFDPPIDPALLMRAAAAGVDLSSVLNDLYAPRPAYRFTVMLQKANELCGDVRALGAEMLATLEKKDADTLALLRSGQEVALLKAVRQIKQKQAEEAADMVDSLNRYQDVVTARQQYYQSRPFMNAYETSQLDFNSQALPLLQAQIGAETIAAILHLIPDLKAGAPPTIGATYGGSNVAPAAQAFGSALSTAASAFNNQAAMSSTLGGHQRRQDDWTHQADLATKELEQVKKQIAAAEVRLAIAEAELKNHDMQIEHLTAVDDLMHDKFTNQELYGWMLQQLAAVYFQSYQLAYSVAKRAERAFAYDLALKDSNYVQFGYWDSLKKGLLAGERLSHDLKRMEVAYLDQNQREYEVTKHVSLLQLDATALIALRQTGTCEVSIPEALFDLDFPGHYLRRMRQVSVTIPCVTGPYAGVPCTLTLLRSSIRHSNATDRTYPRDLANDDSRFTDMFGSIQSVAISTGQGDSGLFDPNLRDERYLPFEGAGVISTWRIELPSTFHTFDYETIADVILHLRYTARDGRTALKATVATQLQTAINAVETVAHEAGAARLFSLKQEFPTYWRQLTSKTDDDGNATQAFAIAKNRFPFLFGGREINISSVDCYALPKAGSQNATFPGLTITLPQNSSCELRERPPVGRLLARTAAVQPALVVDATDEGAQWVFTVPSADAAAFRDDIDDVLLVCHYTLSTP